MLDGSAMTTAAGLTQYRPQATNAAMNVIATLHTSGLAAVTLREYCAYSPDKASVSSTRATAASGVSTGIQFAAAGTINRIPHVISSTPIARHPACDTARICFASSSNFSALYAPP